MTQEWVGKLIEILPDESDEERRVKQFKEGCSQGKQDAWALRYLAMLVANGVGFKFALETYRAGEYDYDDDLVDAAEADFDAMSEI